MNRNPQPARKTRRGGYVLLLVAMGASARCGGQGSADPVILSLGEEVVRRSEFERHIASIESGGGERLNPAVLPSLLDTYLEERVLVLEARARGLVKAGASADDEQLAVQQLLQDQVLKETEAAVIPDAEIAAYYDSHPEEFRVAESVTIRQILVPTENEARDVRRRLVKDPKTFEALARASSRGPEAASGGLMGVFTRAQLPAELETAAFSVPVGGMSDVIRSSLGYHVLRVDSRVEARTASREESEGRIRGLLLRDASDRKVREFVSELLARAKVNHEAAVLPSRRP